MTDGAMGEMPDWYPLLRSARALHQAPWVMAGIPDTADCHAWVAWTEAAQAAEYRAAQRKTNQS